MRTLRWFCAIIAIFQLSVAHAFDWRIVLREHKYVRASNDSLTVLFKDGVSDAQVLELAEQHEFDIVKKRYGPEPAVDFRVRRPMADVEDIATKPAGNVADSLVMLYPHLIREAYPVLSGPGLEGVPNDPSKDHTRLQQVHAYDAWDLTTCSYPTYNILVGMIDTGIRYTHEDLANAVWSWPPLDKVNFAYNTTDPNNDDDTVSAG